MGGEKHLTVAVHVLIMLFGSNLRKRLIINTDISGFTAWSSQREPPQVFALLETIYGAFDKIAYRHSVMKIETVGDCYVAACGLPEPREEYVFCRRPLFWAKMGPECLLPIDLTELGLSITVFNASC